MRDLKHLIFFEDLLQDANNALVQAACAEGRHALAYNCSYIPEVLLDVEGCFSVRLRAPRCTNPDLATYYMTNRSCPYSKSILSAPSRAAITSSTRCSVKNAARR